MRSTLSLIRREFTAYFWSPVAYVVFGTFLLGTGWLFHLTLDKLTARGPVGTEFPMQEMLGTIGFWLIFWVIPPLLTMRLFAEEPLPQSHAYYRLPNVILTPHVAGAFPELNDVDHALRRLEVGSERQSIIVMEKLPGERLCDVNRAELLTRTELHQLATGFGQRHMAGRQVEQIVGAKDFLSACVVHAHLALDNVAPVRAWTKIIR